ncbi:MAG: C-GCAxxG-C-C family protein [Candidatus Thorarchaeota archaeon]
MTTKPADTAKRLFQEQKAQCAQAIFAAYGVELGQGNIDFEMCMKIAGAFSGGVAGTGNICGALNGALMAIGLKYDNMNKANEVSMKLFDEFTSLNGSIHCRQLINHDLITEEDVKQAFATGAFNNCAKYVEDVTMILDKLLGFE